MTLLAFPYIQEGSEGTPGLWNSPLSIISANMATLGQGNFQQLSVGSTPPSYLTTAAITIAVNSAYSDYLYLTDSSGARSNYVIGSRAGGTADGLNIWDASGATMIVSFSKQSIRFFQNIVGPVFDVGGALANTLNAATYGTGADSTESRIQAAINDAGNRSIARVYLPASMQSFSASSVSFIYTVQMVGEGTDWTVWDTRVYGAKGDGVTDDRAALQECENSRPTFGTMRFASGKTYLINRSYDKSTSEASKLLKVRSPGVWDLNGAHLFWGSTQTLVTGTDGAGLGMINALVAPWSLLGFGTLNGNSLVRSPLCFKDDQSGFIVMTEIKNLLETPSGVWDGTQGTVSVDVTGVSFTTRAKNISGIIRRPSCPMMTPVTNVIATHVDVTAFIWGGGITNEGNHTSHALVLSDAKEPIVNCFLGLLGVPQFVSNNTNNVYHGDFSACDLNSNAIETQGFLLANAWSSVTTLGHAIKNGAVSGWFDYNVVSSSTRAPNVRIQGGSAQSKGLIEIIGPIRASDDLFPISVPSYAFLSEASLGWTRSGASAMNLSYGTLYLPSGISTGGIVSSGSDVVATNAQLRASRISTDLGVADRAFTNTNWMRFQASTVTTENIALTLFLQGTGAAGVWSQSFGGLNGSSAAVEYARVGGRIDSNTAGSHTGSLLFAVARGGAIVPAVTINSLGQLSTVSDGRAIAPSHAFSSESSLGMYRSGVSTISFSYGTVNLATQAVRLSMRTQTSLDSTNLAVDEVAFSIAPGSSGASLAIRSGGTIFYFASSNSTKAS